jgi:hypothetical protein
VLASGLIIAIFCGVVSVTSLVANSTSAHVTSIAAIVTWLSISKTVVIAIHLSFFKINNIVMITKSVQIKLFFLRELIKF